MTSPVGLHRVLEPVGVLPQAAWRLNVDPRVGADEIRIRVERLNLDAASFRQLREKHGGVGPEIRAEVLDIIGRRGKMHNPVTGSGGMLIGTVEAVGPMATAGVRVGDRVASLVSLTLTPLAVTDGLAGWRGDSEQVPCEGHAILFGRTVVAVLPPDLPEPLALAVLDVCGAPALTDRVVRAQLPADPRVGVRVAVLGGAGKSGSLALAAARRAGAGRTVAVVPTGSERDRLVSAGLAAATVVADARDPVAVSAAVRAALGSAADVTVVCVDVAGCEHGAVLATADGGTVVFFSMATSFSAAALGAEGLAADVTLLVGNGFVPGHAELALRLLTSEPGVRGLFEARLTAD
ncbi:zinc-binding alcohol dehydrogenase [Micromonospora sp. LOL_023]|uniref:L-erythro-3,5-diaminohexanoate dehydrogenase n=1 Tax=Micromonospora sp. LOL_023 TaxID=3345418 RepID=UPI003A83C0A6